MLVRGDFLAAAPDGDRLAFVDGGGRSTWDTKRIAVVGAGGARRVLSDSGRADLRPEERLHRACVLQQSEEVRAAQALAEDFARLVRARVAGPLGPWLERTQASELIELREFALMLRRDRAAVDAALAHAWSNGQSEGQVNRLKGRSSGRCTAAPTSTCSASGSCTPPPDAGPAPRVHRTQSPFTAMPPEPHSREQRQAVPRRTIREPPTWPTRLSSPRHRRVTGTSRPVARLTGTTQYRQSLIPSRGAGDPHLWGASRPSRRVGQSLSPEPVS
jgi:hypothetical protein